MKVKEIKELIKNLNDEDEIYIGYDDCDENYCDFLTADNIIESANNHAGAEDFDESERFTDVDSALQYLMEMDYSYHYMW